MTGAAKSLWASLGLAIVLAAAVGSIAAASAGAASLDLLKRAVDPNPTLSSFVAKAKLSAMLHALVPVHKSYSGTVYYLKPKRKIVFENVSGPLSRFKELASTTPSYEQLLADYAITPLDDDGTTSTYSLTPKKSDSRVRSIEVTVDDSSALVSRIVWSYTNGGTLRTDQTYTQLDDFHVLATEAISARFPDYSVDGTLSFSDYQLNAPVAPSMFAQ